MFSNKGVSAVGMVVVGFRDAAAFFGWGSPTNPEPGPIEAGLGLHNIILVKKINRRASNLFVYAIFHLQRWCSVEIHFYFVHVLIVKNSHFLRDT
jgi:hypothetical protein